MILESKYYSQFINGENFNLLPNDNTNILVGNVGDKIQKVTSLSFSKSTTDDFSVSGNTLTWSNDFIADGWQLGDVIDLYDGVTNIFTDRKVTAISPTSITFDGAAVGAANYPTGKIIMKTELTSVKHSFGLIGLSESVNYISKVDGTAENIYFAENVGLDTGGGRTTSPITMTPINGVKSWQTDETATAAYVGTKTLADDFAQVFEIVHTFTILPFYLDGELPNLQSNVKPNIFNGANTLRYVSKTELAQDNIYIDGSRFVDLVDSSGSVGWYNENLNGFFAEYELQTIVYTDAVTSAAVQGLQTFAKTSVLVTVKSNNNRFVDNNHTVQLSVANTQFNSEYQQNNNSIEDNFVYERLIKVVSDADVDGTLITNFSTNVTSSQFMDITFDVEFTSSQAALVQDLNSLIFVSVSDDDFTNTKTDRVSVLVPSVANVSETTVEDLILMRELRFSPQDVSTGGFGSIAGWHEDGFITEFNFDLNQDELVRLKSMLVKLSVYNNSTEEFFDISQTFVNVNSNSIVNSMQYYNMQSTSDVVGFKLAKGSEWNKKTLVTNGVGVNGSINVINHDLKVGMRLNYEDWISLPGADTFFYDPLLPNNGLNLDSSRFDTGNFEVVVKIDTVVEANKTDYSYSFFSQPFTVCKAEDDDDNDLTTPSWVGSVKLYDIDSGNEVDFIQSNKDTRVEITFDKDASALDIIEPWARIRLYKPNSTIYTPFELGTYETPLVAGNPLKFLNGETDIKITNVGSQIVIEAMIDSDLISPNEEYCVSGRIGEVSTVLVFNADVTSTFTSGLTGVWNNTFAFSEDGGADLSGRLVRFKIFENDDNNPIADVGFVYGDDMQSDAPVFDALGTWVSDIQPHILAGSTADDGGVFSFDKLGWASANFSYNDPNVYSDAEELRVEVSLVNSAFATDLMTIELEDGIPLSGYEQMKYSTTDGLFYYIRNTGSTGRVLHMIDIAANNTIKVVNVFIDSTSVISYFDIDDNNPVNGHPTIYAPLRITTGSAESTRLYKLTYNNVTESWDSLAISGNFSNLSMGSCSIIKGATRNGEPLIFSGCTTHSTISGTQNHTALVWYYNGSAWTYVNLTSVMTVQNGLTTRYMNFSDSIGRIYQGSNNTFGGAHAAISRIEFSGDFATDDITDLGLWSQTLLAGSYTADGNTNGLGTSVRMNRFFQSAFFGEDLTTPLDPKPIIFFRDIDGGGTSRLKKFSWDSGAGDWRVETISTNYLIVFKSDTEDYALYNDGTGAKLWRFEETATPTTLLISEVNSASTKSNTIRY